MSGRLDVGLRLEDAVSRNHNYHRYDPVIGRRKVANCPVVKLVYFTTICLGAIVGCLKWLEEGNLISANDYSTGGVCGAAVSSFEIAYQGDWNHLSRS